MFELKLKNRELQKQLFDYIGAGTITPEFLIDEKFKQNNKSLNIEYFEMEDLYKPKSDYTDSEIKLFVEENKDQLKKEYIDFKYVALNPKNLIGVEEFNQEFFDKIDKLENQISQGDTFESILKSIDVKPIEVNEFAPNSNKKIYNDLIYSKKDTKLDLIESGDNFLLYSIEKEYDRTPDLSDEIIKDEIVELIYQKRKFDYNRKLLEDIQNNNFNDNNFEQLSNYNKKYMSISSINDDEIFEKNSLKIIYSLPINSFTLVNNIENKIYLIKIAGSINNQFNKSDENYLEFVKSENTNNRKNILQTYDQLMNIKYQVQLNQKTLDRVKNYFK